MALVLIAYERGHRSWAIAAVLLAEIVPGIALSAPFGALADRLSRTRLAVAADLLRGVAFIALAMSSSFTATVAFALLAGVGTALFRPAVGAALPELVSEPQRSAAVALYSAIINLGLTAGPALTALALLVGPPKVILGANGVTFLVSAGLLAGVELGRGSDPDRHTVAMWEATIEGVRAAKRTRGVAALLLLGGATVFAGAVMNVAEPLLATGPLHAGAAGFSLLVAVYGTGTVAGSLLCGRCGSAIGRLRSLWIWGYALCGAGMLGSAAAPSLVSAACAFALTGAANALIVTPELRLFQELTSPTLLGRVLGLRDLIQNAALLAAFLCAGALLSPLDPRAAFALGGTTLLMLIPLATQTFRPDRRAEATASRNHLIDPTDGASQRPNSTTTRDVGLAS